VKDNIKPEGSHYDILLIDDDPATLRLLTTYFKSKGVTCTAVTSGTQGLEELENNRPKVVLLDIILPDIDGFEICKKIKSIQTLKNIPVYFISTIPSSEVEKRLAETKADGYILAPFAFSDFDGILDLLGTR
jgi:twitching motility two-component system response regulator PilG